MYKFTIPGEPMGKQRHRQGKWGTYTPEKTVSYENLVKLIAMEHIKEPLEGSVSLEIVAYFSIPKSVSKKNAKLMRDGYIFPQKKPDWDNIGKIISDSLNGIAYKDDSCVGNGRVIKKYSDAPRVEVTIERYETYLNYVRRFNKENRRHNNDK